jgi:hypothetical protein
VDSNYGPATYQNGGEADRRFPLAVIWLKSTVFVMAVDELPDAPHGTADEIGDLVNRLRVHL